MFVQSAQRDLLECRGPLALLHTSASDTFLTSQRDLLKRHVTNHDSKSANKRQKREIARDTRAVQACEACSQSHLRCEDAKPCSRCKKKNIICRVPENAVAEDYDVNELDAVHAAQDLLDLSNRFDYPSSQPGPDAGVDYSSTPRSGAQATSDHFDLSSSLSTAHTANMATRTPNIPNGERCLTASNDMLPPSISDGGSTAVSQAYVDDPTTSMSFFDNPIAHFDEMPEHDPFLPDYLRNMPPFEAFLSGQATPRGIMDLSFDLDVGLTDFDLGLLDQYNFEVPFSADTPSDAQGVEQLVPDNDSVPVRTEAFKQSIWRYLPQPHKDYSRAEQANLAFSEPDKDGNRRPQITQRRVIAEKLHRVSRDQLMALVLGTCSPENVRRIASAFPSLELLDGLIQYFLTSPALDAQSWFHLPTFSPSKIGPELLACIVSAGAATTPDVPLRKLGFAMHEASRIGQAKKFESDNTSIRDLENIRNLFLQLKVGMWSGISRKMEISESFLQPLLTMLRRGGRFRGLTWKEISPNTEDQGSVLEDKWQAWIHQESYLRVVHRAFELDRQSSMALLKPPLISYSEMQLPLPSSNNLWQAKSAVTWKAAYLDTASTAAKRPSAIDCLLDLKHLSQHDHASATYLYMTWGMVWEYHSMNALSVKSHAKANSNSLILSSRYQELTKQLDDFRVGSPPLSKSLEVTLELMFVHLNAPLDDIQLFAGIEGQEEARGAYPVLRDWTKSVSARQALWHAGQILRAAEGLPKALLCNFNAIAVYHAGLILWGYGFIKRSSATETTPAEIPQTPVVLNGDDFLSSRRFITLNRGLPSIRSPGSQATTSLNDVPGVMDVLIQLLRATHGAVEACPPLVGNLVHLLEGLRAATK
ncbi:hypothetical protein N0V83_002892 [Neocucurbitaria cava]|uniref:Zn(2)-C6 fungal-type domain-containing protein n=1 Tax=Neocucurbitaria cava TaxID=798079 RepID=A0A9W8YDL1_9PLEO|nr:hypothetical protein N0V83_002892 [Neocucurbitaria cava]